MPSCEWCGPRGLVHGGLDARDRLAWDGCPSGLQRRAFVVRRALLRIPLSNLLPYQILQGIFAFRGLAELPNSKAATPTGDISTSRPLERLEWIRNLTITSRAGER